MKTLDLGCGPIKLNGAIGLDNVALSNVDIVHDLLNFPYPIDNESFDTIYLRNVVEHFILNDIEKIFDECFRILNPGSVLYVTVPHAFSIAAFSDITHKSFFTFHSGNFWDQNSPNSYYHETGSSWIIKSIKCSQLTWFDWKEYQLKRLDGFLSAMMKKRINRALQKVGNPSLADRIVKKYTFQFVEIRLSFQKEN